MNLLRSRVTTVQTTGDFESADQPAVDQKAVAIKILLILVAPIALYLYEVDLASRLQAQLAQANARLAEINRTIQSAKIEAGNAQKKYEEFQVVEKKMGAVKLLSKERLNEIKALDYIQTVIPDKIWLQSIQFKDAAMTLTGFAMAQRDFGDFIKSLERSFEDVIVLQDKLAQTSSGTVNRFEVSGRLEDVD